MSSGSGRSNEWTGEHVALLIRWAEEASCYAWLHDKAAKRYRNLSIALLIPAGISGFLTGGTVFSDGTCSDNPAIKYFIGGMAMAGGILGALQEVLKFAEVAERHRISSVEFDNFFRDVSVELSMDARMRESVVLYLHDRMVQFNRMVESAAPIPDAVIREFNRVFKTREIHKPAICNGLHTIRSQLLTHRELALQVTVIPPSSASVASTTAAMTPRRSTSSATSTASVPPPPPMSPPPLPLLPLPPLHHSSTLESRRTRSSEG